MELKQLEYFVACAECGSYGKASEMLYTTQANISKVMSRLEDELGYRVFERNSNGVSLTPGGRMAYDSAREVLEKTKSIIHGQKSGLVNNLYLASVYDAEFPQLYSRFIGDHTGENSKYGLFIGSTEEVLDSVVCEKSEIGFVYFDNLHKNTLTYLLHKKQLEFNRIANAELYLSVGKKNPLYGCEVLDIERLRQQEFIYFEDDLLTQKNYHLDILVRELNIEDNLKRAIFTNSDIFLRSTILETDRVYLHYAYQPKTGFGNSIKNLTVEYSDSTVIWGYVSKKGKELTALCREFIDCIKV